MTRIVVSEDSDRQFIYLSELEGDRSFPIVIGSHEAHEIARVVKGLRHRRPLTHELLHKSLVAAGATLSSVDIVRLERETFFARLRIETEGGEERDVDARPSDAIAVALRARCPLRVAQAVLDAAATDS
ncbi:MAG: bifunctional nuclease family protein [Planctomycetota bacterium]